jgi:hypothetical protein
MPRGEFCRDSLLLGISTLRMNSVLKRAKYLVSCGDFRYELGYEDELFDLQPRQECLAPQLGQVVLVG